MYATILFLPLIGFLIAGLFGRSIGAKASEYITSGLLILAALLSWIAFSDSGSAVRKPRSFTCSAG
jgi:NADH-quinone oxidoreductase subunit L